MKLGVFQFSTDYALPIGDLAKEVEDRGFESLWVPEHTHIPISRKTPYPGGGELPKDYSHTLDPFVSLSHAAAKTKTLRLGTGICLLTQRDTLTTAKAVASLDLLSGGRFELGIGGGWNQDEMENHGTEYKTRFRKMGEQVQAMKEVWTQDEAEFHGEFVDFDPVWSWPKPVQKPHPPVLLGGESRYTLQRVVDYCEGWFPRGRNPERVLAALAELDQIAEEAGRDRSTISVSIFAAKTDCASVDGWEAVGADRCIFWLPAEEDRDAVLSRLDRYAQLL